MQDEFVLNYTLYIIDEVTYSNENVFVVFQLILISINL